MAIQVRLFASLRERMGRGEFEMQSGEVRTVADVWDQFAKGQPMPGNVLAAVNQEHVGPDQAVNDGDEVAFFPPVTGG